MNKIKILEELVRAAKLERNVLKASADSVAKGATSSEAKQEGKYDTRALLDSYLAGAQDARVRELESEILLIEKFRPGNFDESMSIAVGALIYLQGVKADSMCWYFLLPGLGGYNITFENNAIQTITHKTPLGHKLVGLFAGDDCVGTQGKISVKQIL